MNNYFTVKQISEKLYLEPQAITRYIRLGKLGAVKIGHKYLVTESQLQDFINRYNERFEK